MNRINYGSVAPHVRNALLALEEQVRATSIERTLVDLVYLRVSQMNQCAYCIDMHARDLIAAGEKPQRLHLLSAWREVESFFTKRERIALAWAEAVTKLGPTDMEEAIAEFGEKGLVELNLAVATINAWNRFGVTFHLQPGKRE